MCLISQLIHLILYSSHNTHNIQFSYSYSSFRISCIFTIDEGISLDVLSLHSSHAFHKLMLNYRASHMSCIEVVYNLHVTLGVKL